ncbi:MAG: hypothetical protein HY735_10170 [Verrucomicrobia bacterium]|nr:hypothetical protein [Verrucomicrobiota bacterium]
MNTKLALLLAVALGLSGTAGFSQPAADPATPQVPQKPVPGDAPRQAATPGSPSAQPGPKAASQPEPATPAEPVDLAAPPASKEAADEKGPLTLDMELPMAIQFLARSANINIHIDPSITFTNLAPVGPDGRPTVPTVSLRWDNVSAKDALVEVLDIHGLTLLENPKTKISRVTRKPTEPPRITTMLQLKYSNPTNVMELIRSTFADTNKSRVTADFRTSQLLLVATEPETEAVTNLVAQIDTPTRQVLIEARLLETSRNPKTIKGIDWSGTLEAQNVTFGNGRTRGTTTTQTPGQASTITLPSGRTVTSSSGSSARTDLTTELGFGGLGLDTLRGFYPSTAFLNADGLRAVLSFLNSDNETEVVATPRQVTADNQVATLSVTRAFPIFEITPGSAQTPPTAKITYTNLGTILKVTPRIAAQSNIVLKVVPEVSNIDSKDRQIINGDINEANVYAIRRMETEVMIPSGNTLVMGGLISDEATKTYSKVPILGDLPGFGLLFRRDSKARKKSNLIIFVTPTIVQDHDFQPTSTDFLKNKAVEKPDTEGSAWNSGKPHDWTKPVPKPAFR